MGRPLRMKSPNRGILDLKGVAKSRPAIVVGAGPSLARNVDLLAGERDRFVIVATQTVLKLLLAKGIVPHFVCALDWSDLCARFYECITEPDVEGCHLVCQADANPIIPKSWPGVLRMPGAPELDEILEPVYGPNFSATLGTLQRTATVAHMCYALARYMGCDPVIHIGQDLGYTDGLYYGPGAAIHNVWQAELNEFCTLEMKEHERIARNKGSNKAVPASGGGEVYSDSIMLTYLTAFQQQWRKDIDEGLTVIDATEGGVDKRPCTEMTLADALATYRPASDLILNPTPPRGFVRFTEGMMARHLVDSAGLT